ncbi:MAG: peptidoglycan DD-metalloendopeptidase family protein [Pseudomonadota bacterium]
MQQADDPFNPSSMHVNRWLVSGSIAGVACTLVVGAALFGSMTREPERLSAPVQAILQESESHAKGDLVRPLTSAQVTGSIPSQSAIRPGYKKISVSFATNSGELDDQGLRSYLQNDRLVGTLSPIYPDTDEVALSYDTDTDTEDRQGGYSNTTTVSKSAPPAPFIEMVEVGAGDTLTGILKQTGADDGTVTPIVRSFNSAFPVRQVKKGQKFELTLIKRKNFYGENEVIPLKIVLLQGSRPLAVAELDANGQYVALREGPIAPKDVTKPRRKPRVQTAKLPDRVRTKAKIRKSLYMSAREHGVPEHIVANVMRVHSYDVDFQRQIHPGDQFEAYFGSPITGKKSKRAVLLFSQLTLRGKKSKGYYRFTTPDDGITTYYDKNGRSATKSLMMTPISGARISSRYGMRKHPILGYSKMHTGVDFAAPYGTPIKAAGSGVVEVARRVGAYGKYIRIKHRSSYKTAYAHLSRYARGIRPGRRVRQGQIIGYVGSTGRSTGPHLHYEVIRGKRRVNPLKVRMTEGRRLRGKMLAKFKRTIAKIDSMRAKAPTTTKLAANEQ